MEDVYFSEGLQWLVENLPPEELTYPHPKAGLEAAHYLKSKSDFIVSLPDPEVELKSIHYLKLNLI